MRHLELYAIIIGREGPVSDCPALGFSDQERLRGAAEVTVILALAWGRAIARDAVLKRSKPHYENRDAFDARVRMVAASGPRSLHELALKLGEKLGMRGARWLTDDEVLWLRSADAEPGRHVAGLLSGTTLSLALTLAAVAREQLREITPDTPAVAVYLSPGVPS